MKGCNVYFFSVFLYLLWLFYCERIFLSQYLYFCEAMFALTYIFRLDYEKISLVCNLVKLGESLISMCSGIHFIEDMFNSYFPMCYLFLFDVIAKDIHDVIKRGDSVSCFYEE